MSLVRELSVAPIPARNEEAVAVFAASVVGSVLIRELVRRKADAMGRLQRADPAARETYTSIQRELRQIDEDRTRLRSD